MADVLPLRAVHYAFDRVPLGEVISPPYDVSDPAQREALLSRSPLNVIAADLADDRDAPLDVRYRDAPGLLNRWFSDGVLVQDTAEAFWALEQRFAGPDGALRVRRGVFARVAVTDYGAGRIRPHERTHRAAVEDRLALTRATRANLSAIFSLYDDPSQAVARVLSPVFTDTAPHASVTDDEGTVQRLWRVGDATRTQALAAAFAGRELLIADGHHRYEAARRFAAEVEGDGPHRHTLMLLVARQDPGLVVLPTHRLVGGLRDAPERLAALEAVLAAHFDVSDVDASDVVPPAVAGPFTMGLLDGRTGRARRATLVTQATADAALPGVPDAYRRLDTAVFQTLILEGALGLTAERIEDLDGLGYARSDEEARAQVRDGTYDLAFFLRPCPVEQVAGVAAAGLTMPAKSTSFAPKVPAGLLLSLLR